MPEIILRSKESIMREIKADEPNPYIWDIALPFLEVLIDIRDILSKDLPKINKNLTKMEMGLFKSRIDSIRKRR